MEDSTRRSGGVRKRAPNACIRCRQQKIKCSGLSPCEQCNRRNLSCTFDNKQQKVLVSRSFLADLERQAALNPDSNPEWTSPIRNDTQSGPAIPGAAPFSTSATRRFSIEGTQLGTLPRFNLVSAVDSPSVALAAHIEGQQESESEDPDPDAVPVTAEAHLANPLAPGNFPSYTADSQGRHYYFGTSSNWSFGRRVLNMAHERVSDAPLLASDLLFESSTYDLGWDGQRAFADAQGPVLPTLDFALHLINSVKFHCGQLYHMFDERTFMVEFYRFHDNSGQPWKPPVLWYMHYLIILAFGKAFVVRSKTTSPLPGSEFFTHAMKMLPDITYLSVHAIESIEVLSCAALYLQCLDHRAAAYNLIGQAARIALNHGMHTDMQSHRIPAEIIERYRAAWWTIYILDRQMSALLGSPVAFADEDVSAWLPSFDGSVATSMALGIHVKLCQATTTVLQTVYCKGPDRSERFLVKMKEALKTIAAANDERNDYFPLDLKRVGAISRLSAYLHLFHHQCIILATRPLLFSFWQKRLETASSLRVSSSGGARSMLRVCVGSAQQSINILRTLQSQGLLESFLPFDLEAVFSSSIVLSLANAVDSSLLRDKGPWLQTTLDILDEMISRGNLIAGFHKSELQQLDAKLSMLPATPRSYPSIRNSVPSETHRSFDNADNPQDSSNFSNIPTAASDPLLSGWNSDEDLSGEQILALADALDFNALDFGQLGWFDADFSSI